MQRNSRTTWGNFVLGNKGLLESFQRGDNSLVIKWSSGRSLQLLIKNHQDEQILKQQEYSHFFPDQGNQLKAVGLSAKCRHPCVYVQIESVSRSIFCALFWEIFWLSGAIFISYCFYSTASDANCYWRYYRVSCNLRRKPVLSLNPILKVELFR